MVQPEEQDVPCLSENDCRKAAESLGIESFYASQSYPTKGCYQKNDKAFFSAGTMAAMSEEPPGQLKRIWCSDKGRSRGNMSSLGRTDTSGSIAKMQQTSDASSAVSLKALALGSLLHNTFSSTVAKNPSPRRLDTCTYNVEILMSGCGSGIPTEIEVTAPKARVINSSVKMHEDGTVVNYYETNFFEDVGQLYNAELRYNVSFSFPTEDAQIIVFDDRDEANVPVLEQEEKCWEVVCGRPFVDVHGDSVVASAVTADVVGGALPTWLEKTSSVDNHSPSINSTNLKELGREWTKNALAEHASVASFAAFAIALMSNQAPSDLVEDALKAAQDEVRHAKVSFEIASKLIGKEVSPGPLPPSRHYFEQNLTSLALAVAKEGCVDETLSALAVAAEAEMIDHAITHGGTEGTKYSGVEKEVLTWIRDELQTIAIDESMHSHLAWRTLDWICTVDVDACEITKQQVLNEDNLAITFQRHVGIRFEDNPQLLEQMVIAWKQIYARQIGLSASYRADGTCTTAGEGNSSLISILVENVSSVYCLSCDCLLFEFCIALRIVQFE